METTAKKVSRGIGWGLLVLTLVGIGVGSTIGIQKLQNLVKGSSSSSSSNATSQTSSSSTATKAVLALSLPKYEATSTSVYKAISATIAPNDATFKTIAWSVSDSSAIGFSATDGGTTTAAITSESGQNVYIKALKNFSGTVAVVAASAFNNTLKANCDCTYANKVSSMIWQGFSSAKDGTYTDSGSFTDGSSHGAVWSAATSATPVLTMATGSTIYAKATFYAENQDLSATFFGTQTAFSNAILYDDRYTITPDGKQTNLDNIYIEYDWVESTEHSGIYTATLTIETKMVVPLNGTKTHTANFVDKTSKFGSLTITRAVDQTGVTASSSTTEF